MYPLFEIYSIYKYVITPAAKFNERDSLSAVRIKSKTGCDSSKSYGL